VIAVVEVPPVPVADNSHCLPSGVCNGLSSSEAVAEAGARVDELAVVTEEDGGRPLGASRLPRLLHMVLRRLVVAQVGQQLAKVSGGVSSLSVPAKAVRGLSLPIAALGLGTLILAVVRVASGWRGARPPVLFLAVCLQWTIELFEST